MLWLEMSRDVVHGGEDWGFTECLWSPARNRVGKKWRFWETLLRVRAGDQVLHLRGKNRKAQFVGISTCAADGHETQQRPPSPGQWGYAKSFYRVPLSGFSWFSQPIKLYEVFTNKKSQLLHYLALNKVKAKPARTDPFFVLQAGRLQPLNGAYLSGVDLELARILLDQNYSTGNHQPPIVETGSCSRQIIARLGQEQFAAQVKANHHWRCCFPGCDLKDESFLVGAHIARWADVPPLRGDLRNGLCFCLMHDKAFELGYFTVREDLTVEVGAKAKEVTWAEKNLVPFSGSTLKTADVPPSAEALRYHWSRHGFQFHLSQSACAGSIR